MVRALDLDWFLRQLQRIHSDSVKNIIRMIPGIIMDDNDLGSDREVARYEAIIRAMTPKERKHPEMLEESRRRRIARGSGAGIADILMLIKTFDQVRDMAAMMYRHRPGGHD